MDDAPPAINHQTPAKFAFHLACLINVGVLLGVLVGELAGVVAGPSDVVLLVLGSTSGLLAADLVSGVAHWAFDTYGTEDTPVFGALFIKQFRVHHDDPMNITRTPFVRINGDNAMLAGAFVYVVLGLREVGPGPRGPFGLAALIAFGFAMTFTNLFHQWSHRIDPPPLARLLHRARIVLTPRAHERHHTPPYGSDYCITFGWLNPVLERLGFFRRAEAVVRVATAPFRGPAAPPSTGARQAPPKTRASS